MYTSFHIREIQLLTVSFLFGRVAWAMPKRRQPLSGKGCTKVQSDDGRGSQRGSDRFYQRNLAVKWIVILLRSLA